MKPTDARILNELIELITNDTQPQRIANVLDDVYYVISQNVAKSHSELRDDMITGDIPLDESLFYIRRLRDIFAQKHRQCMQV